MPNYNRPTLNTVDMWVQLKSHEITNLIIEPLWKTSFEATNALRSPTP